MFWIRDLLVPKGFQRYTSAVSCTLPQRMASQFTGTDKANLLSTALTEDSGDNIAITATSDAVATGLDEKDTIVLGEDVTNFTASGGVGNDTILVSGSATGSDIQGNRGDDTLRITGELQPMAIKGGQQNDTIYLTQLSLLHPFYGGSGNDSITYTNSASTVDRQPFPGRFW